MLCGYLSGKEIQKRGDLCTRVASSMDMSFSKLWEMAKAREAWRAALHGVTESRTQLGN